MDILHFTLNSSSSHNRFKLLSFKLLSLVLFIVVLLFISNLTNLFKLILLCGDIEVNPGPRYNNKECRILYSNIRGLYGNFNELQVASQDYDIVLCSETLVSNRRNSSELLLPNFCKPKLLLRDSRPRVRGLATYIRSGFAASMQSADVCNCHEIQLVRVCGKNSNFYIFSLYRNPDLDNSIFDCMLHSMHNIQERDRKSAFVFVGDLNTHHSDWLVSVSPTNSAGVAARDFSNLSGCEQLIDEATHNSGNCLDLLLSDVPGIVDSMVKPPLGNSDHCLLAFKLKMLFKIPDVRFSRKVYLKGRANWAGVVNDVENLDWHNVFQSPNMIDSLNSALVGILNNRIPSKIIRSRLKDKMWFNDDCRRAYNEKQSAYRLWSHNRSRLFWDNYVSLRSAASDVYLTAQAEYNSQLRESLAGAAQPHEWWSCLKSFLFGVDSALPPIQLDDGSLAFDPLVKAELLSSVFQGKQSNWSPDLPPTCHTSPKLCGMAFRSSEIKHYLDDLDSFGSIDPNNIFPLFLKKISKPLAPKFAKIIRTLLASGSFPQVWRSANVTPIPKGGTPSQSPLDYRPISITPVLSKVYEKLLSRKLHKFVADNNLLPKTQFGFRKGVGTTDALLVLTHDLQCCLDSRSEARVVSLDFSSAFDLVNHSALLYKLESFGVSGPILNVFREFLTDRQQRVSIDGQFGAYKPVLSGVPQGSVLGPLLFILYTADMWIGLENKLMAYADDTTLYSIVESPHDRAAVADSINRDLSKIQLWCQDWGMKLNPIKTQSIIVSRSRTSVPVHPALNICGLPIAVSSSIKLLGVTIDDKLTFEKHIRAITSSIAQKTGLLRKCFKTFQGYRDVVLRSFFAFILPCFEYCMPVWQSAAQSHLRLLDRALNSVRFILPNLNINLDSRRLIGCLSLLFKIFKSDQHPLNSKLPAPFIPGRVTRRTEDLNVYSFQYVRFNTSHFSRCFVPRFCELWNDLPNHVVCCSDRNEFKTAAEDFYS